MWLGLPGSGASKAEAGTAVQELRGRNILVSSSDVEIAVRVSAAVPLSALKLKITGGGDSSLALIGIPGGNDSSPGALYVVRSRRCSEGVCSSSQSPLMTESMGNSLTPGEYRLVALSKSRTLYRLRIRGLDGKAQLVGHAPPKGVNLRSVEMEPAEAQQGAVFSGGVYQRPSEQGLSALFMWWRSDRYSAGAFGSCYYTERPPVPRGVAFAPACPVAGWNPKVDVSGELASDGGSFLISTFQYAPPAVGGWFSAPAPSLGGAGGAVVLTIY